MTKSKLWGKDEHLPFVKWTRSPMRSEHFINAILIDIQTSASLVADAAAELICTDAQCLIRTLFIQNLFTDNGVNSLKLNFHDPSKLFLFVEDNIKVLIYCCLVAIYCPWEFQTDEWNDW